MTNSGACIGLSPAPLPAAMLRGAVHDASETRGRRFAVRFALYGRRTCAPTSGWRGWSFRVDATVEETAHERQSTRIFGEYAFLEDSRYASQPKNISGRIRREWSEQPRGGVLWVEAEGRGTFQRADLCDAFIKVGGCRYDPRLWNPETPLTTLTKVICGSP